jgi:hypothetical protein
MDAYSKIMDLEFEHSDEFWITTPKGKKIYFEKKRPHGEWNYIQSGMCVCPFCGAMPHKLYKNFCAKCGADMREDEE